MPGRLDGKRVVLVGAGQSGGETVGFGRATALLFASEGARVMIVDVDRDSADETAAMVRSSGSDAVVHTADHTSDEQCAEMVTAAERELGGVDVLYNGVGIHGAGEMTEIGVDFWDRVIDVNLKGMFLTARNVVPLMIRQGTGGSIVLISSMGALGGGGGAAGAYGVAKAGVNRLALSLAASYAPHGIRCNAIMPGFISTPMAIEGALWNNGRTAAGLTREEYISFRDAHVPMPYKGAAIDVAYAALYFAADESRYVSGALLPVDGAYGTI